MRFTLRELLGAVILLPPIAYASGYFLWIGASVALYGVNLAPCLGVPALMEPGIVYAATIVIALLTAFVVGFERLSLRPFQTTRRVSMVRQSLFWFIVLVSASALAQAIARGRPLLGLPAVLIRGFYVLVHVVLLTASFRRLVGLLHASATPPVEERRRLTPATRLWQGCLFGLLVILQIYLALLFSVLGPNTAMRVTPIVIEPAAGDSAGPDAFELLLLERSRDRVLGYHPERRELVEVRMEAIRGIRLPRFSHRQLDLLAALRGAGGAEGLSADQAAAFFPIRPTLMKIELEDLVRSGEVRRLPGGALRLGAGE